MYGYGESESLSGVGANRIHVKDKYGVKKIQGWASYKKITEDEIYQQSDIIVKGTVKSTRDFKNNINSDLKDMYSEIKISVDEYIRGENSSKLLTFLQMGQTDCPMAVDPVLQVGEQCILYLHYGIDGNLYVVGGVQGVYKILADDRVVKQIDLYTYNKMKGNLNVTCPEWNKISKNKNDYLKHAKQLQVKFRKSR